MSDTQTSAVTALKTLLTDPGDSNSAAFGEYLAEGVVLKSPFMPAEGREGVLAAIGNPMISGFIAGAEWSEPSEEGDAVTVKASLPPGRPLGGFAFGLVSGGDGKVIRIEQDMLPPAPVELAPLKLTEEIRTSMENAIPDQKVALIAYVDAEGQPRLSYRGSTQVYSDDQLAMWIRDPNGGLVRAIAANPRVTLMQGSTPGMMYEFQGRARVDSSEEARERVYSGSAQAEQNQDWRRRGVAVIIDLDRVDGLGMAGRLSLARQ